ncbi:MAG: hypothetical protein DWQ36_10370 [Acidobacteria bacterium]|nr:MAG: hypothetical protein DWQ30_25595 [Acidobacteriota bacterium]REK07978.1 MAG: hypothetical protein DWQ36_10370 [Acidobacteriota bacterium]
MLVGSCRPAPPEPERRLNVVVLCLDTLRADHVGRWGYERPTTPNLDALADGGVVFSRAYTHSPWTVPATATLLTSLLPSQHLAGLSGDFDRNLAKTPPSDIQPGATTLAQALSSAGYRTMLLSANPFLRGRFHDGFDQATSTRRSATELNDAALQWLAEGDDRPFFLYLQYMDLHEPIEPPAEFFEYFPVDPEHGPRSDIHRAWRHSRVENLSDPDFVAYREHKVALYDGALRYLDEEVGRLLDALPGLPDGDSTLVVVTSDHGEEFWDHATIGRELGGDPRDLWGIGHGHTMFEELLSVPLLFSGPNLPDGGESDCEVGLIDVAPTVLDLVGVAQPDSMQGRSLAGLARESAGGEVRCPRRPILAQSPAYGPDASALVLQRKKLISRADDVELFYDLLSDPEERNPKTSDGDGELDVYRDILQRAARAAAPTDSAPPAIELDEEARKQLEALGYLSGN